MTVISLLSQIIAQGGKTPAAFFRDEPAFEALLRHGFLKESGIVASVVCEECEEPHAAQIVFEDGSYGHYCPDLGFVSQIRADLQVVQPDLSLLIGRLAEALDTKRRKADPLHGRTWRIGAVSEAAEDVVLYFHPLLHGEEDARDLDRALSREVRSQWRLIVTAHGTLPVTGAQAVRLNDLAELNAETGALCILARPANLVGMPRKNSGGAPNRFGELLSELILQRETSGEALPGRNEESKALLVDFKLKYPDRTPPILVLYQGLPRQSENWSITG